MKAWIYAILITFGFLLIIVYLPALIFIAIIGLLIMFIYNKYGSKEKREFAKLNKKNRKIQYENARKEKQVEQETIQKQNDDLKSMFEEYKEKKKVFSEKNNIESNPFFFWERYGKLEKIFVIRRNDEVYLFNASNNYNNFKEDYNNSLNKKNLFEKNGTVRISEDDLIINDTRHIIKNTYHYTDATGDIFLGSLFFGSAGALAGAVNSKPKQKELTFEAGDVTITVKNEDNNARWEIPLDASMLITISEIFPNIKVDINNKEERNNLYV